MISTTAAFIMILSVVKHDGTPDPVQYLPFPNNNACVQAGITIQNQMTTSWFCLDMSTGLVTKSMR